MSLTIRSVSKNVGACFNYASEFLNFVTDGYLVLAAMQVLGLDNLQDDMADRDNEDKRSYPKEICKKVVDIFWEPIPDFWKQNTTQETRQDSCQYCIYKEDLGEDEPMIQCLNRSCPRGSFFHLCCFNLEENNLPDELVCGDTCRKTIEDKIYCVCQSVKEEPMVECSNEQCDHHWFHVSCKGIKDLPDSDEEWFCTEKCKKISRRKSKKRKNMKDSLSEKATDRKFEYSKAILIRGMEDKIRRDAVRENDGPSMCCF